MKRIITLILGLLAVFTTYAQNSFEIRVGGGIGSMEHVDDYDWLKYETNTPNVGLLLQPNFMLKKGSNWSFSPSLKGDFYLDNSLAITANLNAMFGYRFKMGKQKFFAPKVGPFVGLECYQGGIPGSILAGVATDLSFELKHFVIGVDGFYSVKDVENLGNAYSANLTFGVKIYDSGAPKKVKVPSQKVAKTSKPKRVKEEEDLHTLIHRAETYLTQKKYSKAASWYKKAAEKQPERYGGPEIYNAGICYYNNGKYVKALKCFNDCSVCYDLSQEARKELPSLIADAKQLQQEKAERRAQIFAAVAVGLAQAATDFTQNYVNAHSPRTTVNPVQRTSSTLLTTRSSGNNNDDEDEDKDIDIKDIKIKCLECGGSGKCHQSGVVDARTTRCGGNKKCPMCNGRGRSWVKCTKCKGDGCSKCEDTGYLECTACEGSGDCKHCGGTGKCPRCGGTKYE